MYEYFSVGKQVVSSSWEELELLKAPCLLAKNKSDFLELIKGSEVMNPDVRLHVDYAKANTWEVRLQNTIKLI
jgi:hypothetical protein